ncbi:MAG: hypothetical protein ACU0B7_03490 [Paracoccaceae bacterium]
MHVLDITIDHTKVAADLTDFPVLVVPADSPDWDALYAVATGSGGDIRAFKAGGTVELPREIVSFSIDLKTGEIHIKYTGTLSSTVDTVIELYADGVSADYAVGATYGRNNVWGDYQFVHHWEDVSGTTATDSAGNSNATLNANLTQTASGYIESGITNTSNVANSGANTAYNGTPTSGFHLTTWAKSSAWNPLGTTGTFVKVLFEKYRPSNTYFVGARASGLNWTIFSSGGVRTDHSYTVTNSLDVWDKWDMVWDGSNAIIYKNGSLVASRAQASIQSNTSFTGVGQSAGGDFVWNGFMDESRHTLNGTFRNANWITTEYNNQSSPSTFYAATAVATGTAYTLTCEAGTLVLGAAPSALSIGRAITAEAGTLALAAEPATLGVGRTLSLETGALALTGTAVSLAWSTSLVADPGNLSLEAQNAALRLSYSIDAQTLDMAINGAPAAIYAALTQPLEPGSLLLSGEPVDFVVASIINPFCPMDSPFALAASPFSKMDSPFGDFPKGDCQ